MSLFEFSCRKSRHSRLFSRSCHSDRRKECCPLSFCFVCFWDDSQCKDLSTNTQNKTKSHKSSVQHARQNIHTPWLISKLIWSTTARAETPDRCVNRKVSTITFQRRQFRCVYPPSSRENRLKKIPHAVCRVLPRVCYTVFFGDPGSTKEPQTANTRGQMCRSTV